MEEEKKNKRKATILMIVGVITLIALVVGATYAYFQAQIGTGKSAALDVKAGTTDDLSFSLSDLNATKEKVVDNNSLVPIVIEANQTNFASGNANIADGVSGTATLIAGDDDYKAEGTYNVYLNITKNELKYSSYIKKVPDETPENILSFKDEAKKTEADLSNYNPRPELYLTIKKNGTEIKTGVTINDNALNYSENVFTKDDTQLGGFDITETKGLIKIKVPETIIVNEDTENHTTTDTWEITVTFMNLDTDQNLNTGKSVVGEVLIQKEKIPESLAEACVGEELADCIKNNYQLDKAIIYHNAEAVANTDMANKELIAGDDSYRYTGGDDIVHNYVCLDGTSENGQCDDGDNNLYRIIGLFKNGNKYEAKLVKATEATKTELGDNTTAPGGADVHGSYYWNNTKMLAYPEDEPQDSNMWQYSNLNTVNLNDYYLNKYLAVKVPNLVNHITKHNWEVGGFSANSRDNAKEIYNKELGDEKLTTDSISCYNSTVYKNNTRQCNQKNDLTYTAKIGLIYVSDYAYAAFSEAWNLRVTYDDGEDYDSSNVIKNNWLCDNYYGWTISRDISSGLGSWYINGEVRTMGVYRDYRYAFPSFYLTSETKLASGDGTHDNPYRLKLDNN